MNLYGDLLHHCICCLLFVNDTFYIHRCVGPACWPTRCVHAVGCAWVALGCCTVHVPWKGFAVVPHKTLCGCLCGPSVGLGALDGLVGLPVHGVYHFAWRFGGAANITWVFGLLRVF